MLAPAVRGGFLGLLGGVVGDGDLLVLGLDLLLGRPGVALISDPEHHRVIEDLTAAQTALFSVPGTYQYDFERTDVGFEAVLTYGATQIAQKVK